MILHIADLHGRVDRLSSIAAYVAAERRRGRVLVVDSGDFFQGTPEGDLTRGRAVLDAYNEIGVEALVPGNHDFDLGPGVTKELAGAARFPFLAANLRLAGGRGPPPWVRASLVVRGPPLELLGLVPDEMKALSTQRAREGLAFSSAGPALASHAWTPRVARILVSHLGIERDRALPLNGIVAVLGGHSHVAAVETRPGGTILLHPGSHGTSIGRLELELDAATGVVRSAHAEVVDVPNGRDAQVEQIIEERTGVVRRAMDERVGRLHADLPRGGPDHDGISSPLGNHLADLVMKEGDAEASVILRSSIRGALFAGPVRRRDLYEATPFPDTIVTSTISGAKLRAALERAVAVDERLLVEVAGIAMTYDRAALRGRRIRTLEVAGAPLDVRRRYRVATLSFMTEPGGLLAGGADFRDSGKTVLDVHTEFLRGCSIYRPPEFRPRVSKDP